jgi:hypothetical protein
LVDLTGVWQRMTERATSPERLNTKSILIPAALFFTVLLFVFPNGSFRVRLFGFVFFYGQPYNPEDTNNNQ